MLFVLFLATLSQAHGPCEANQWGLRGCDAQSVLWQCEQTSSSEYTWVIANDCGAAGYVCNAVAVPGASAGCQPPPPDGAATCEYSEFGAFRCDANTLQQCAFDPWWVSMVACPDGSGCVATTDGKAGCVQGAPAGTQASLLAQAQIGGGKSSSLTAATSVSSTTTTQFISPTGSTTTGNSTVSATKAALQAIDAATGQSNSILSTGAIAGIAIAGVVVLAVVGSVVFTKTAKKAPEVLSPADGLLTA